MLLLTALGIRIRNWVLGFGFWVFMVFMVLEILKLKIPPTELSVGGIFLGALLNLVPYFLLTKI